MRKFLLFLFVYSISISLYAQNREKMETDWPNLQYYKEANQNIIKNAAWPDVVFMGNSITEGWYSLHPEFFTENNYANRGIGGQTSPQMLLRFMQDVIALKPRAVVILAGTNDIAGNTGPATRESITNNIKAMAQLSSVNGIEVILCSILPVYEYPWSPGVDPVPRIREINTWMKEFAKEHAHTYLDLFSPMARLDGGMKVEYSSDGVHPNLKAYRALEPILQKSIESVLRE